MLRGAERGARSTERYTGVPRVVPGAPSGIQGCREGARGAERYTEVPRGVLSGIQGCRNVQKYSEMRKNHE